MRSKRTLSLSHGRRENERAYVLFASVFARDFYAVVPTHKPIPNLLLGPGWRFVRILKGKDARHPCLLGKPAIRAFTQDGYYLFAIRFTPELAKTGQQDPSHR